MACAVKNKLTPDINVPAGIVFSGYARYGAAYQNGDVKVVETNGRLNGNSTRFKWRVN